MKVSQILTLENLFEARDPEEIKRELTVLYKMRDDVNYKNKRADIQRAIDKRKIDLQVARNRSNANNNSTRSNKEEPKLNANRFNGGVSSIGTFISDDGDTWKVVNGNKKNAKYFLAFTAPSKQKIGITGGISTAIGYTFFHNNDNPNYKFAIQAVEDALKERQGRRVVNKNDFIQGGINQIIQALQKDRNIKRLVLDPETLFVVPGSTSTFVNEFTDQLVGALEISPKQIVSGITKRSWDELRKDIEKLDMPDEVKTHMLKRATGKSDKVEMKKFWAGHRKTLIDNNISLFNMPPGVSGKKIVVIDDNVEQGATAKMLMKSLGGGNIDAHSTLIIALTKRAKM